MQQFDGKASTEFHFVASSCSPVENFAPSALVVASSLDSECKPFSIANCLFANLPVSWGSSGILKPFAPLGEEPQLQLPSPSLGLGIAVRPTLPIRSQAFPQSCGQQRQPLLGFLQAWCPQLFLFVQWWLMSLSAATIGKARFNGKLY